MRSRPGVFAELFATEDLQGAVQSFLRDGPGKASFQGSITLQKPLKMPEPSTLIRR